MAYPALLNELAAAPASGALPFALAQIVRESGAAVHKELLNRIVQSTAARIRDLEHTVFSFLQSSTAKTSWAHSAAKPSRRLAVFAPVLTGQPRALIEVRAYAKSTADGSVITVGEDGGETCQLTIDNNGGEWRLVTAPLQLRSERPTITATVQPASGATVNVMALTGAWRPGA